jgi:hypothetical protein
MPSVAVGAYNEELNRFLKPAIAVREKNGAGAAQCHVSSLGRLSL